MYFEILVRVLFRHKLYLIGLRTDVAGHSNRLTAEVVGFIQSQHQADFAVYLFGKAKITRYGDPLTFVGFFTNCGELFCFTNGWRLFSVLPQAANASTRVKAMRLRNVMMNLPN